MSGFLIGLLWFYWIGYSFEYQGVGYMTPIVTVGFGFVYMLFFGVIAVTKQVALRAVLLFALSFFEPFDFNWMQVELLFVDSYIGIFKYQLLIVLAALSIPAYIKNRYRFLALFLIVFALNTNAKEQVESDLKIKLVSTDIKQEDKWKRESLKPTVDMIFEHIENATEYGYELIVFPESVFPIYMNRSPKLIESLLKYSEDITIITGTLLKENTNTYNVTYMFQKGDYKIAKKLVLVPFGEYIPLPEFAQEFINETFFSGASDFKTADKPTDFIIEGEKFRNAICYEATCQEIYEGDVKHVIAISNNAWFTPSIEPTLQKLLMRYYARKNNVTIYHSANYKGSGIIK